MPFSSVLGASSVIKPGVCTSATRPTVPYEGQLIYETDTDMVAAHNGSAWVYTHSSGLVLISSTTIGTAVSTVTISSAFSSTYDNYKIIISGGVASATSDFRLQLGSTTAGYYSAALILRYSGTEFNFTTQNGAFMDFVGSNSVNSLNADITLFGPNLAKRTNFLASSAHAGTDGETKYSGGFLNDATQYTAFTMLMNTGTITGGTIKVYGYRN